jgi:Tol biopolymer transport system component
MKKGNIYLSILSCALFLSFGCKVSNSPYRAPLQSNEKHLKNITQLTFGGDNAEAYFSFDGKMLVFQSNNKAWNVQCDQIFAMNIDAAKRDTLSPKMLSTGLGRTTCS